MIDIWKSFGEKKCLQNVSILAEEGEIFCVIGPNGAGKTTLLRIANLLEVPDKGQLFFDNVNLLKLDKNQRTSYVRKMAMVFQQPVIYNSNVFDNVAIGLRIRGFKKSEIEERVEEVLKIVNLYKYRKKHAYILSGGEAQRLCLARTLVLQPRVLLLDEPTANLDPTNTLIIEKLVKEYCRENNVIVIFTTHNMLEVKRFADRVALLFEGKIIEEGDVESFFNKPKNDLTLKFIRGEIAI